MVRIDTYRGTWDDPLSLNRYVYCQSNPIRYVDPSGHSIIVFIIAAVALTFVYWTAVDTVANHAPIEEAVVTGLKATAVAETVLCAPACVGGLVGVSVEALSATSYAASAGYIAGGGASVVQGGADFYEGMSSGDYVLATAGILEGITGTGLISYGPISYL